jgi:phage portal protein BeeE
LNKLEQFNALMRYVEDNPQAISRQREEGRQILGQIERACQIKDAEALDKGIDCFLKLFMGDQTMRGFTPVGSQKAIEQFNSIQKATRAVLDKMEE